MSVRKLLHQELGAYVKRQVTFRVNYIFGCCAIYFQVLPPLFLNFLWFKLSNIWLLGICLHYYAMATFVMAISWRKDLEPKRIGYPIYIVNPKSPKCSKLAPSFFLGALTPKCKVGLKMVSFFRPWGQYKGLYQKKG
jgi:hypothetical protein